MTETGRLPSTDRNIVSTSEKLNKIDQSYRDYSYQKVAPASSAANWTSGARIE